MGGVGYTKLTLTHRSLKFEGEKYRTCQMPNNGFIKLHRTLLDWEWYQDSNVVRVFLHLLLKANHTDQKWQGILIKRGQLITSYQHLSDELSKTRKKYSNSGKGISVHQVRTALDKLKLTNEVAVETTSEYSVITINNYGTYQDVDKRTDKRVANEWQTSGKRVATNKNDKNDKNVKNISTDISHIKIQEGMKSLKDSLVKKGIIHESI